MANFTVTPTETTFFVQVGENTAAAAASAAEAAAQVALAEQAADDATTNGAAQVALAAAQVALAEAAADEAAAGLTNFARATNALSTGNRTALFQVNTSGFTAGTADNLVDGVNVGDDFGGQRISSGTAATAISAELLVRDRLPRIFKSITIRQTTTGTAGTFSIQGVNEDGSYTNIVTGQVIGGATSTVVSLSNTVAYYGIRIIGTSGTASTTIWWTEVEFEVGFSNDSLGTALAAGEAFANSADNSRWLAARRGIEDEDLTLILPSQYRDPITLEGSTNTVLSTTADAGGNKVNADGTLTIGAGSYVEYPVISADSAYDPGGYYYLYVVPKDPARVRDLAITLQLNDSVIGALEASVDVSTYGVLKLTYRNRSSTGTTFTNHFPRIRNNGATAVEIYRPSLTRTDDPALWKDMLSRFVNPDAVTQPEIRSFEFWRRPGFFDLELEQYLQNTTNAVDENRGNNANPGTRFSPKATLAAIGAAGSLADGAVVVLGRSSVWNEQLAAYYGSDAQNAVFCVDDWSGQGDMPKITAFTSVADSDITDNGDGTFSFSFSPGASSQPALGATDATGGYHKIGLRERNVALDAAGDVISARTSLRWEANSAGIAAKDGAFFATYDSGTNTFTIKFKPRPGVTPKDGTNTYEVTNINSCIIHQRANTSGPRASVIGLHLDGAVDGYGMFSAGSNSLMDFCVLSGGDTHHAVIASGRFRRSLIVTVGDVLDSITVSYGDGADTRDTITEFDECFVVCTGGPYGHNSTGEGDLAEAMIVTNSYLMGRRRSITNALSATPGRADQTKRTIRRGNYGRNLLEDEDRFAATFAPDVNSEDNFWDGIGRMQALRGGSRNNIAITANFGDKVNAGSRGVQGVYASPGGTFENQLVIVTHENGNFVAGNAADHGATVINSSILGNAIVATAQARIRRNIFVVYLPFAAANGGNTVLFNGQTAGIFGNVDLDENIYVLLNVGTQISFSGPAQDLTAPPTLTPPAGTGGTANAITLTTGQSLAANPGTIVFTTAGAANTGAVTVNIDGLGAVALGANGGAALASGALAANTRYVARLVSGAYQLCTLQTHTGFHQFRQKTGYEANGHIIDARGHPLGLDAVFRDFANRDLRFANTYIAHQIERINQARVAAGKVQIGPPWTVNRQVDHLSVDQMYRMISRRAPLL